MMQSPNGQPLLQRDDRLFSLPGAQGRFTAERVLRTRPKTYRAIVQLLADPGAKIDQIAKLHRVSTHTVRAIRAREAVTIAERKQRLMSIFGNVAEISAERMEELAGQASLRDAGITAGIATDKLLALSADSGLTIQCDLTLRNRQYYELHAGLDRMLVELGGKPMPDADHFAKWNAIHDAIRSLPAPATDSADAPPPACGESGSDAK
jgi:Homeodomain-like domain-containing protein